MPPLRRLTNVFIDELVNTGEYHCGRNL